MKAVAEFVDGLMSRIFVAVLICFVVVSSALYAQVVVSQVNVSDSSPNHSDTITVAINIDMSGMPAPDSLLGSFTADLYWDPTVLSFVSHSGVLQGYLGVVNTMNADSGNIRFNGAKPTGTAGSFDVLVITFETVGFAGQSTNLQLQYSAMAAAFTFNDLLPFLWVGDGFVTVAGQANNPPVLTPIPDQSVDVGAILDVPISAMDPDGDTITLTADNLPAFATFVDSGNGAGALRFAPQAGDAGAYPNIQVIATDIGAPPLSDTTSFTLTVNDTGGTSVIINELDSDTPGIDDMEFIELYDGGIGNTPLDGMVVVFYNGATDVSYRAEDLDGFSTNASGYFVLGNAAVPNVSLVFPNNTLQNGADAVALYFGDAVDFPNGTPVTTANLIDAIVYDTDDPDDPELLVLLNPGQPQVNENGAGDKDNHSNQRIPNGSGGARNTDTYVQLPPTPGTENIGPLNNPPAVNPIPNQTMDEGTVLNVGISASDPDGDNITLSVNNLPSFGSLVDSGNGAGSITFTPGFGDDGFYPNIQVIASDDGAPSLSDTVSFDLTVNNLADSIIIARAVPSDTLPNFNDTITVAINIDISGMPAPDSLLGSFTADLYWDPNILSFVSHSGILQGYIGVVNTMNADSGNIRFNGAKPLGTAGSFDVLIITFAAVGFPGQATSLHLQFSAMAAAFTFIDLLPYLTVQDGTVTMAGIPNNPPLLNPISDQSVLEGTTLDVPISATDPDGDNITLSANNLPSFGTLTDNGDGTGTIGFSPGFGDAGVYPNIQVIATDNGGPNLSDTTAFTLTVLDSNRAPIAVDDSVTTPEDTAVVVFVLANDIDPDNDPLTVTGVTQPANGSAAIDSGDTTVTYTPDPNFFGADSFDYTVSYGIATDVARVYITVLPVNDPPTISGLPDTLMFDANASVSLDIWAAVEDVETPDSLLIYGFAALPDTLVLSFDANTGMLEISAKDTVHGVNGDLFITVQDPEGATASDTIFVVVKSVVSIEDPFYNQIPQEYVLMQNFPNPFNPATRIRFGIPQAGRVRIEVFNLLGQRVASLMDEHKPAGYHVVGFDASQFSSGIYFYRIQASHYIKVRKMLLSK